MVFERRYSSCDTIYRAYSRGPRGSVAGARQARGYWNCR
nr:MAG TPA: hypothetical protein [Caudoviricetes sp.]